MSGFPLVAHQPTGWTRSEHKLIQKSLVPSWPKPFLKVIKPALLFISTLNFQFYKAILWKDKNLSKKYMGTFITEMGIISWYAEDRGHPKWVGKHTRMISVSIFNLNFHPDNNILPTIVHRSLKGTDTFLFNWNVQAQKWQKVNSCLRFRIF